MWNRLIWGNLLNFKFSPVPIIHWENLTIELQEIIKSEGVVIRISHLHYLL